MQTDGNFVVYAPGKRAIWNSQTGGSGNQVVMQGDGNLVVYGPSKNALWNSGTGGTAPNAVLVMQTDGNLVIYSGGRPLWSSYGGVTGLVGNSLSTGQSMSPGQALWSSDGAYEAVMQTDGNFVVYAPGQRAIWSAQTGGSGNQVVMQGDGNLVVYGPSNNALWNSGTGGKAPNGVLVMQTDGNLVIYSGGRPLWSSDGGVTGYVSDLLGTGQTLSAGQALWSSDGAYEAVMQTDGNFVVYGPHGATWSSQTAGSGNRLVMQGDGNLVVYGPSNNALWNSGTGGRASNAVLAMQTDGNLVIYSGSTALWSVYGGATGGTSGHGQAIVNAAASMAGRPYCWDGGAPSGPTHGSGGPGCEGGTVGFDCSGLALFAVYQAIHVVLPHGHGMESGHGGSFIGSQSQLQPGDLVFFGGGSLANFDHVGIYAGNNEVWDAADYNIPVQKHSLAWIEHSLAFDGAVRY
jgi:cell wall-associated NlpC family hydrolase